MSVTTVQIIKIVLEICYLKNKRKSISVNYRFDDIEKTIYFMKRQQMHLIMFGPRLFEETFRKSSRTLL